MQAKATIHIHGQARSIAAQQLHQRFNARQIFRERILDRCARSTTDFHFHGGIAHTQIALHFLNQSIHALAGVVIAAGRIDPGAVIRLTAAKAIRKQAPQRHAFQLGRCIPKRHVQDANRDRTIPMPARLFIAHHRTPSAGRAQPAFATRQFSLGRGFQAGDEAFREQTWLRITAIGIKAIARRFSARTIFHRDGNNTRRHFGKIYIGIGDGAADGHHALADGSDTHGVSCLVARLQAR